MKYFYIFLFIGVFQISAQAQTSPAQLESKSALQTQSTNSTTSSTVSSTLAPPIIAPIDFKNIVEADIVPMIQEGFGLLYLRNVSPHIYVGPAVSYIEDDHGELLSSLFGKMEFEILRYGAEARFTLSKERAKGAYLSAAYNHVQIQGRGNINFLGFGNAEGATPVYKRDELVVQLGYMLEGTIQSFGSFFIDLAINYGKYEVKSYGANPTSTSDGMYVGSLERSYTVVGALGLNF